MGVAIGDYNHTGLPSIFSTTYENEYKVLYRNNGDWDFKDVTRRSQPRRSSAALGGLGQCFCRPR